MGAALNTPTSVRRGPPVPEPHLEHPGSFPTAPIGWSSTWHGLGSPFHRIKIYVSGQPDLSLGLRPMSAWRPMFPQPPGSLFLTKAAWADLWGGDLLAKLPHPLACCGHLPPHPGRGLTLLGPGAVPRFLDPAPPRVLIAGAREGNSSSNLKLHDPRDHGFFLADEAGSNLPEVT